MTRFQSDAPLIPFINDEMVQLFTKIMRYFVKRNVLEEAGSDYKLINIDVAKKENRKESSAIKLPTATNNLLLKSGCSKEKKIKFQGECAVILMNIILKLQERSPVKSVVVRKASCLSPVNMARQSEISVAKFESLVNKLFQGKHLTAKEADGAKSQYDDFLKSIVRQNLSSFEEFNFSDDRLDQYLIPHLHRNSKYQDLWKVCIFVFTMSHGQGAVKRGFNINKYLLVENIRETSTRGQRLVYDYFQSFNVKLHEYAIPKELLLS